MTIEYIASIRCDGCHAGIDHCEAGSVRFWLSQDFMQDVVTRRIEGKVRHFCSKKCEAIGLLEMLPKSYSGTSNDLSSAEIAQLVEQPPCKR